MHIPNSSLDRDGLDQIIADLGEFIHWKPSREDAPCPNCPSMNKPGFDSMNCSYQCQFAARAMSEEPERYPIETGVLPIVFELARLHSVRTCWSCEGHHNQSGEIWKYPQVSFYCPKPMYAQLISNYLAKLYYEKQTRYAWMVRLTNFGRDWDMIYSITCDLSRSQNPSLHLMREDLKRVSVGLDSALKQEADDLIATIERECKTLT